MLWRLIGAEVRVAVAIAAARRAASRRSVLPLPSRPRACWTSSGASCLAVPSQAQFACIKLRPNEANPPCQHREIRSKVPPSTISTPPRGPAARRPSWLGGTYSSSGLRALSATTRHVAAAATRVSEMSGARTAASRTCPYSPPPYGQGSMRVPGTWRRQRLSADRIRALARRMNLIQLLLTRPSPQLYATLSRPNRVIDAL